MGADAETADHAADIRHRGVRFRRADIVAAERHLHQDEADHRQHAVRRHSAGRPVLRAIAAGLRLQFGLQADG
ncbi:hypothetical protein D3C78_1739520 [compost metagenome]